MKKLILIASLFALSNTGICQKHSLINTKDIRPLSFGAMPVIFVSADKGPGLGLELNTRYGLNKDFGVSVFGRMKSILQESRSNGYYNDYGPQPTSFESTNVFAIGATADYNLFRVITLQLKGGYEVEADVQQREMIPRAIFGGGLIVNFGKSKPHRVGHSLRIGVEFESNRTLEMTVPTADFSDFPYSQNMSTSQSNINAFSIQVGWNFQFYNIKRKK